MITLAYGYWDEETDNGLALANRLALFFYGRCDSVVAREDNLGWQLDAATNNVVLHAESPTKDAGWRLLFRTGCSREAEHAFAHVLACVLHQPVSVRRIEEHLLGGNVP